LADISKQKPLSGRVCTGKYKNHFIGGHLMASARACSTEKQTRPGSGSFPSLQRGKQNETGYFLIDLSIKFNFKKLSNRIDNKH